MSPEELATKHPKLYHVTEAGAWESISRLGLHSTKSLLKLFEISDDQNTRILSKRRPLPIPLEHPLYGHVVINDNFPISESNLAKCLEDNLSPSDWLRILNSKIFFFVNEDKCNDLLSAKQNTNRPKTLITLDTLSLSKAYADFVELSPINSGATIHQPAKRGLSTFTPLLAKSYEEWRRQRGKLDKIKEVAVTTGITNIADFVTDVRVTNSII